MQSSDTKKEYIIAANTDHCVYCFDVLMSALHKTNQPIFPEKLPVFDVPVFVTFHINGEDLRGCIGTFSAGPVQKQLQKFTINSAFKDTRFDPITKDELEKLDVGVSFLVNFQNGKKWNQWEVGTHGIIIDFSDDQGRDYGATFLPEVASEQGWDQRTTLKHLIRKAGYNRSYENVLERVSVTTYETSKVKLTYQEYKAIKSK